MALAMMLALLPTPVIGKEPEAHLTETIDYSHYLTDSVITKKELTFMGMPFYDISMDEAIQKMKDSMPSHNIEVLENHNDRYNLRRCSLIDTDKSDGHSYFTVHLDQRDGEKTLYRVQFPFRSTNKSAYTSNRGPILYHETGIRGISANDSIDTLLKKLGISEDGINKIAESMQKPDGQYHLLDLSTGREYVGTVDFGESTGGSAPFDDIGFSYKEYGFILNKIDEKPCPTIFFHDDNIRFQFDYWENRIMSFTMWKGGGFTARSLTGQKQLDEYVYDGLDLGENTKLPTDLLEKVTDSKSAADVVKQMIDGMTSEQKSSPAGIDLATLYAETAVSKAASKTVEGEVIINADSVADVEAAAKQAASAVETALVNGSVATARYLAKTVILTTDETGEITIKIDPDILTTEVDKIRVETPGYALTLKTADLAEDLTEVLTITAEEVGSGFAPDKVNRKVTVKVTLPKGRTTNPVTVSLPADKGATTYQAVVKTDGSATSSKYNPATTTMDGKINTSGTYTVQTNEKSFTDISNKSAEMQKAILYLTSKGIINGTSATTFSPNGTINRQQVAALLMRALGKVDNTATAAFKDVSAQSSLYHEIASSKKHKIVNGYSDNTFRGTNVISRAQIVTVAGRVLTSEMNYKAPSNTRTYLAKYSDTVPDFAKEMVALATRENLVVYRTDGTFSGGKNMTRGDAAIILYRLFQRIW
jgi:hypothetical protein